MTESSNQNFVTWRDLGEKIDEVYDAAEQTRKEQAEIGANLGERLARLETKFMFAVPVLAASYVFGGDAAKALGM